MHFEEKSPRFLKACKRAQDSSRLAKELKACKNGGDSSRLARTGEIYETMDNNILSMMKLGSVLFAAISISFITRTTATSQEVFMEMPSSINVVIGTNATFNCTARAHSLVWFIDGEHIQAQHLSNRNISYTLYHNPMTNALQSTLIVAATEINNMSTVQCEAYVFRNDGNLATRSDTAIIRIQDRLGVPRNLTVNSCTPGKIRFSWSPPFTLDITDTDKDITHYSVYVNESETMMQEIITVTEGLQYTFLCSRNGSYYFSVSGFNSAGEGTQSDAVIGTCTVTATVTVSTEEPTSSLEGMQQDNTLIIIGCSVGAIILLLIAAVVIIFSTYEYYMYGCCSTSKKVLEISTRAPDSPVLSNATTPK